MQLFCFTFAGGTAAFFDPLEQNLGASIEVVKLEYAGHGARHRESFYDSFSRLAEDLFEIIQERRRGSEDYAFLGYSMGSISAVEVLKRVLHSNEMPPPVHMFLAAHEPYVKRELLGLSAADRDELIKARTIEFGGIPERLIENRSFWRVYLPIYRADYSLIWNYDFQHLDLKSNIPATVFYSETDTPLDGITQWTRFFSGKCEFVKYEGNHFFIQKHCREMADVIKRSLLQDEL